MLPIVFFLVAFLALGVFIALRDKDAPPRRSAQTAYHHTDNLSGKLLWPTVDSGQTRIATIGSTCNLLICSEEGAVQETVVLPHLETMDFIAFGRSEESVLELIGGDSEHLAGIVTFPPRASTASKSVSRLHAALIRKKDGDVWLSISSHYREKGGTLSYCDRNGRETRFDSLPLSKLYRKQVLLGNQVVMFVPFGEQNQPEPKASAPKQNLFL